MVVACGAAGPRQVRPVHFTSVAGQYQLRLGEKVGRIGRSGRMRACASSETSLTYGFVVIEESELGPSEGRESLFPTKDTDEMASTDPSCNTDQGVSLMYECLGVSNPHA